MAKLVPQEEVRDHVRSMAEKLMEVLEEEQIRFVEPRETVMDVINLLYRAVPAIAEMDNFMEAFHVLVLGACNQVVA